MKRLSIIILILLVSLAGCRNRPRIIPDDKFSAIIKEFVMTEASLVHKNDPRLYVDTLSFYEPILASHGYTMEDLKYTVKVYSTRKSALLTLVIKTASEQVREEAVKIRSLNDIVLKWEKMADMMFADTVYRKDSVVKYDNIDKLKKSDIKLDVKPGRYVMNFRMAVDTADKNFYYMLTSLLLDGKDKKIESTTGRVQFRISPRINDKMQQLVFEINDTTAKKLAITLFNIKESQPDPIRKPMVMVDSVMILYHMPIADASDSLFRRLSGIDPDVLYKKYHPDSLNVTIPFILKYDAKGEDTEDSSTADPAS